MDEDSVAKDTELYCQTVGSSGLLLRSELLRLIIQSLRALDLPLSAAQVENESHVPFETELAISFRQQILEGRWDNSIETLKMLLPHSGRLDLPVSIILQQSFFELLCQGDSKRACNLLWSKELCLCIEPESLHELATWLLVKPEKILQETINRGRKPGFFSREELLQELQRFLSPTYVIIPDKRLESILETFLMILKESCIFHNVANDQHISLLLDHQCEKDQIPSKTLQVLKDHKDEVWFVQFSHNGDFLASGCKDCTAIIWQVMEDGFVKLKHTLTHHQKPVCHVAWSPDDQLILACSREQAVVLWDVESGICSHTFCETGSEFCVCAWSPCGKKFLACDAGSRSINVWNIETKVLHCVVVQDLLCFTDMVIESEHAFIISQDHIRVLALSSFDVLDEEHLYDLGPSLTSVCVSKDGRFVLTSSLSQQICLWEMLDSGFRLWRTYTGHQQIHKNVRSCFGGFEENFIVSGSEDSKVYIWHASSEEVVAELDGHSATVNCASWNPVNPFIFASASNDHTIRIWGCKST